MTQAPASPNTKVPRLILAFYSLPICLEDSEVEREYNWTVSAIQSLEAKGFISGNFWVGYEDKPDAATAGKTIRNTNLVSVEITPSRFSKFYNGFCRGIIWPLLHAHTKEIKFDEKLWKSYLKVNRAFADQIRGIYEPGDLIWIHGYHLMMLPQYLREKIPEAKIGWFLHAPFPSFELFRIVPRREELLYGILSANLVGFQTYTTAGEFSQTCSRILGDDTSLKEVVLANGHTAHINVFPLGIDPTQITNILSQPTTQKNICELKKTFGKYKVIIARDHLDRSTGILEKLKAFETLLERYPAWQGNLVYFQICQPLAHTPSIQLSSMVNELVGQINGRFSKAGYVPIELHNRRIKNAEMVALNKLADVALITPLRAGMSTDVHEYVAAHGSATDDCGVVVASEFAGSSRCFGGALIVNPFSNLEVAHALNEALNMEPEEAVSKHKHNWDYVQRHTNLIWAEAFLTDLMAATKPESGSVPQLPSGLVKSAYKTSQKRLFLLNYDSTLAPANIRRASISLDLVSPQIVVERLAALASDPLNHVYVVSGREKAFLERWIGKANVGLCCSQGSYVRPPGSKAWIPTADVSDPNSLGWKDPVLTLMNYFAERTPGASVDVSGMDVRWNYSHADPQYSKSQAQELLSHLRGVTSKFPVDVTWGKDSIEMRQMGVDKGFAVKRIIQEYCVQPDFIFCVGDEKCDESMFNAIDKTVRSNFTVCVKTRSTSAKYYVRQPKTIVDLLSQLTAPTTSN